MEARVGASATGGPREEQTTNQPTLQQRILEVPNGTMIEVRLLNKQKLRGRLGAITSEGFALQTAQGSTIGTQKVAFTDVKAFKQVDKKTGGRIKMGILIGVAAAATLMVIELIVWASGGVGG